MIQQITKMVHVRHHLSLYIDLELECTYLTLFIFDDRLYEI